MMRVFHRTIGDSAADIRIRGFYDASGTYLTDREHIGVWISDVPLAANENVFGETLLTLTIPADLFARFEWHEEGKGYREALVPAETLNQFGRPRIVRPEVETRWFARRF